MNLFIEKTDRIQTQSEYKNTKTASLAPYPKADHVAKFCWFATTLDDGSLVELIQSLMIQWFKKMIVDPFMLGWCSSH